MAESTTYRRGDASSALWGGPLVLGALMVAFGVLAFIAAGIASLASILAFGALLVAAGATEIAYAFRARKHGAITVPLLSGVLSLAVGALLVLRPMAGLAAASLVLAGYFLASGLFRAVTSLLERREQWGWDLLYGVTTFILGVILLSGWPASALWTIGVLVGIELVFRGSAIIGASLALRRGWQRATV